MTMKVTRFLIGLFLGLFSQASAQEVVIALDSSASIGHHINDILEGVQNGVSMLPENYTVSVIAWDTLGIEPLVEHLPPDEASAVLSETSLTALGKTNMGDALIESFHMFNTDEEYKTIIIVSDGLSNASMSPDLISQEISLFNKIEISAISISRFSIDRYRETVIYGPGSQVIYALHVRDIANAIIEILE